MAVSLTLLTLHVVLVLLADAYHSRFAHRQTFESDGEKDEKFDAFERLGKSFESDKNTLEIPKPKNHFAEWKKLHHRGSSHGGRLAAGDKHAFKDQNLMGTGTAQFHREEGVEPVGPSVCGDDYCTCFLHYADCSGHDGDLSYIPMLPNGTRFLNFSHNMLRTIENENFFENVTNRISGISLSNNQLTYISPMATRTGLRNLSEVYLDFNYLHVIDLTFIIGATGDTLERLDYRIGTLGPLPSDIFYKYPMPRLKAINLFRNNLQSLNMTAFKPLRNLEYLAVEDNNIGEIVPDFLPSLKILNLRNNTYIKSFMETCAHNQSLLPNLLRLDFSWNGITHLTDSICLPQLALLDLTGTGLLSISADTFGARNFPSLWSLHLEDLHNSLRHIERNAFNNPSLQVLKLRYNATDFGVDSIDPGMFSGLTNLSSLYLGWNSFSGVSETKFRQLFSNMTSLQTLDLQGNNIEQLYDGVFDKMTQLKVLNLSTNRISMVKESTFSPETRKRLHHLDLSGNPFNCSEDLVWFCQWMRADPGLFNNSFKDYECANKAGVDVTSICSSAPLGSDAVEAPMSFIIYRVRQTCLIFFGIEKTAKPQPHREDGDTPVTPPHSSMAHNPWSHNLYATATVSASLLILLVVMTAVVTVCCGRHGRLRRLSQEGKPALPTKANVWRRLVQEEGVTCSTVTLTDKK